MRTRIHKLLSSVKNFTAIALLLAVQALPLGTFWNNSASAEGHNPPTPTYTEQWDQRGKDSLACNKAGDGPRDADTGWIHWVFSTKGASTDADLTLGGSGSGVYSPAEPLSANVWHFFTPFSDLDTLTATTHLYGGAKGPGGGLVISDYCPGKVKEDKGKIKVDKKVDLGNGYIDDSPSQYGFLWGLDAETPERAMGTTATDVPVGNHKITENTIDSYEFTGWYLSNSTKNSCTNPKGTTLPATVGVNKNQTRHVTLCNRKIKTPPTTIIVDKQVINNNGGTAKDTDWDLFVNQTKVEDNKPTEFPGNQTYTVSEANGPKGYEQKSLTCYDITRGQPKQVNHPFTAKAGSTYRCKIVNDDKPGKLVLIKRVINEAGGKASQDKWTLKAEGLTQGATARVSGKDTTTDQNTGFTAVVNAGTYKVSEHGGPNGYKQISLKCGSDVNSLHNTVNSKVTVANGQTKVCVFVNKDKAPQLTVIKKVENNWGGTLAVKDFTLKVGDLTVESGVTKSLSAGWYVISESQQPGYELEKAWGDCKLINGKLMVELKPGKSYDCYLKNVDKPGTITVHKKVINDNGGTKKSRQFDLNIGNKKDVDHGKAHRLKAGQYRIWEDSVDGYALKHIKCYVRTEKWAKEKDLLEGKTRGWDYVQPDKTYQDRTIKIKLALDQDIVCIVTNDDLPPRVTVKKVTHPGKTNQKFYFELEQKKPAGDKQFWLSGGDSKTFEDQLKAGEITVSEKSIPDGWVLSEAYCKVKTRSGWKPASQNTTFTAENGKEYLCVFVNDRNGGVSGHKFEDKNGDGSWDKTTEPTLRNWTIELYKKTCAAAPTGAGQSLLPLLTFENSPTVNAQAADCGYDAQPLRTTVTDTSGAYRFDNLDYGWYKICEVQQAGWTQTTKDCHEVELGRQSREHGNLDFGNFQHGRISGYKFHDVNGNGSHEQDEEKLQGWEITLYLLDCSQATGNVSLLMSLNTSSDDDQTCTDKTKLASTLTDQSGAYAFNDLKKGTYLVCETQRDGWTRTFPDTSDCHKVAIDESCKQVEANFGNAPTQPGEVLTENTLADTGTPPLLGIVLGIVILASTIIAARLTGRRIEA